MTKEKQTKDYSGTIFDDVFRTMAEKFPELFVALINEAFGTDYSDNVPYEELKNEHYAKSGKLITDALFKIDQKLYHFECQSKKDVRMIIRMFEYDVAIAIENASENNGLTEINFPDSCVVYIRNHTSIGKEHFMIVNFPDGQHKYEENRAIVEGDAGDRRSFRNVPQRIRIISNRYAELNSENQHICNPG